MVWNKFWKEKTGDPFLICNHYAECVKDYKENIITAKFGQIDRPLGTDGGIHNVRKKCKNFNWFSDSKKESPSH